MTDDISFTKILDWVDGRLGGAEAESVARVVSKSPEARVTEAWIRELRAAGQALPLAEVPDDLRRELRLVFRRHRAPWTSGKRQEGLTTFDSRDRPAAAGMRGASTDEVQHVVLEGEGLGLALTIIGRAGSVDLKGTVSWPDDTRRPEVVLSIAGGGRRAARPDVDGRFGLSDVSRSVDEVWVVAEGHHLHAHLDLGPRR